MESLVNILMVDDEARNLDVLESFLAAPGYNLVRALSAEQALLHLLEGDFATIVLDIQMPEISGIELANLIKQRKRTQHIPIIFLTAYYQEDKDVLEGYGIGAVDYLTKPINPKILKSKIDVFVDLYRKTRALTATNAALEAEVLRRQSVEAALQNANNELENRVTARTKDLNRANQELREREAALRVSEAEAKAASRAKDDFLAALSHELRTPLNPVLLLASEAANNPKLSAEVRSDFQTIANNVSLEARLIDDMLDLTRIAHGKLVLEALAFDVHSSLRHAVSLAQAEIDLKGIHLTTLLKASRHVIIGDDARLKQAFWNVIKNAAKFTPAGGRITVETATVEEDNELLVTISDTGIGMTSSELTRIFHAFAQGDHVVQGGPHRFGGIGLGLAISQAMVKRHSGTITAFSAGRNRGTSFVIKLPLAEAGSHVDSGAREAPPDSPAVQVTSDDRPIRVLLVEDHQPTSNALSYLLARRGYDVVPAASVSEARTASDRGKFDILISDIGLPDGSGYELMAELQNRAGLVGIALSGYGMEDDIIRSQEAGFVTHLIKPVTIEALDRALATVAVRKTVP